MHFGFRTAACLVMALILGGCAIGRSELDVSVPALDKQALTSGKTVFINSSLDKRVFEEKPRSADIPSLDPGKSQAEEIKSRAVGRKRNTYGMALGDILLKDGTDVQTLISSSIAKAFNEKGYSVLTDRSALKPDTVIVDSEIFKFWSWMNPGFWALALSTEISTDLKIEEQGRNEKISVAVKSTENFQTAVESNWLKVINEALRLYIEELKGKIK